MQRLARLLDTRVSVSSELDRGSVFRFSLPATAAPALMPDRADPPKLAPDQCVLVVDDDDQILEAMSLLLQSWGVAVLTAHSLAEAGERLDSAPMKPTLVLLDHHLNAGTSPQAHVDQLRSWLPDGVPLVIITGDTSTDAMRELAALAVRVWHKPVDPELLRGLLKPRQSGTD